MALAGGETGPRGDGAELPGAVRAVLERWLDELLSTPGLTGIRDPAAAWEQHVEDSLRALPYLERFTGAIVDVGSGGGSPGIPLAAALPGRGVTLLEANGRRCEFLRRVTTGLGNVEVVQGRAEEQPVDTWGVAVAKALAPPPVAAEWCLALVRPGGCALLYVAADAPLHPVAAAAARLGGGEPELVQLGAGRGLFVLPKLEPTPSGFPRRPGVARKRPLA